MGQFYRGVPLIKVPVKKELTVCEFEEILRNLFCCCSHLHNDDIIFQRPGLKKAGEKGYGF